MTVYRQFMETAQADENSSLCRHFEQMKALVVPLGLMREISPLQSTDQGALTEIKETVRCTVKAPEGVLQT